MIERSRDQSALPHGITRDVLEADGLRAALIAQDPTIHMIPDAELRTSIDTMLAAHPAAYRDGIWLFGYGSLLWNPCVAVIDRRDALLYGFHRNFCIRLHHGRGAPEAPALMLGLVPGGSCRGTALQLGPDNLAHELLMVWRREMLTGVYRPRWVGLHVGDRRLPAVTFVTNPQHANYCGRLPDATVVELLATGAGSIGTAADYLNNTVAHLDAHGIRDRRLRWLRQRVRAAQNEC